MTRSNILCSTALAALMTLPGAGFAALSTDVVARSAPDGAGMVFAQSHRSDDGTRGFDDQGRGRGRGADDGPGHDIGDDHGRGGHGADDGPDHDMGDDHGGGHGGHGGDDSGGHGGHGGDDSGGHGGDHSFRFQPSDMPTQLAKRGRSKPRIPGGSGCDDPHDLIEHPECRV